MMTNYELQQIKDALFSYIPGLSYKKNCDCRSCKSKIALDIINRELEFKRLEEVIPKID